MTFMISYVYCVVVCGWNDDCIVLWLCGIG